MMNVFDCFRFKYFRYVAVAILMLFVTAFVAGPDANTHNSFPYKQAGLTERQAATHLLSRFTYGATPGQVDEVLEIGIEKWFQLQLQAKLPGEYIAKRSKP